MTSILTLKIDSFMGENIGFSAKFDTDFGTFAVDMHEVIGSSPTAPTKISHGYSMAFIFIYGYKAKKTLQATASAICKAFIFVGFSL